MNVPVYGGQPFGGGVPGGVGVGGVGVSGPLFPIVIAFSEPAWLYEYDPDVIEPSFSARAYTPAMIGVAALVPPTPHQPRNRRVRCHTQLQGCRDLRPRRHRYTSARYKRWYMTNQVTPAMTVARYIGCTNFQSPAKLFRCMGQDSRSFHQQMSRTGKPADSSLAPDCRRLQR